LDDDEVTKTKPEYLARKRARYHAVNKHDPEYVRQARERSRRSYMLKTAEQRAEANAKHRKPLSDEARERRNALRREARAKLRGESPTREIVRAEKKRPKPIPTVVRDAWKRSERGSILQRKYPSYDKLKRGAARGDFDHLREVA
jgi:hypothetical protein